MLRELGRLVLVYTVVGGGALSALVGAVALWASSPPGLVGVVLFGIGNLGLFVLFGGSDLQVEGTAGAREVGFSPDDPGHVHLRSSVGRTQVGLVLVGPGVYGLLVFAALMAGV